jgi:hypothetical protein
LIHSGIAIRQHQQYRPAASRPSSVLPAPQTTGVNVSLPDYDTQPERSQGVVRQRRQAPAVKLVDTLAALTHHEMEPIIVGRSMHARSLAGIRYGIPMRAAARRKYSFFVFDEACRINRRYRTLTGPITAIMAGRSAG